MTISMEWYRVFYWTAKLGGITSASKQLNITQPAVSHTIKQLEATLDSKLLFRSSKGVRLTVEGEVLYQFIEQAMQLVDLAEKKMIAMQQLQLGELTIGASDTLCKHYLLPKLKTFHERYPEIKIKVINRTSEETTLLLREGVIDFGLIHSPTEQNDKFKYTELFQIQDCLIASTQYEKICASPFDIKEIERYPLLMLEEGSSTRHFYNRYALHHGIILRPEFELGSIDLIVQFVMSGFGFSFVSRDYVHQELISGKLIEIPLKQPIPKRTISLITLKDIPLSSAAHSFIAYLLGDSNK